MASGRDERALAARRMRTEGKLHREIAEALGICRATASAWTRGVLPHGKRPLPPRKAQVLPTLEKMYRAGHPIPEIARVTGVPQGTLFDWRRELGLPKNRRSVYVTEEMRQSTRQQFSRDLDGARKREVARLYTEEQLSTIEIGQRFGLSAVTIGSWLKELGVPTRTVVTLHTRQKLRTASTGPKRWNWKGGISNENVRLRTNLDMKLTREACFKRDDYTCLCCGQRGGKLNAHHVWPFQRFPEWKYKVWNLVTLCKKCHDAFHKAAGGHVHVAIGPFFHWKNEVREQPAVYEYRINVKSRRKFRIDPDSRGQRLWLSKSNRRLSNTAW